MTESEPFVRDRVTVLAYGALASYAYCLYALGPVLAFLRDELHLSYTVTSLHSSLWAAATIAVGLTYSALVRRTGRRRLFWWAAGGTIGGALLFSRSHAVGLTLLAAGVLGSAGTLLQTGTSVVLADRHGERRDRALVEANIGASATAVSAPLILGRLQDSPLGWRAGLLVPVLALAWLYLAYRREPLPVEASGRSGAPRLRALPPAYWLFGAMIAFVVAAEFCVVFYGAVLLHDAKHVGVTGAATTMSLFFAGELAGRVVGAGLTTRPGRSPMLLVGSLAVTAAGFAAFWLSGRVAVAAVGLFVTGAGVGNLYPLSLALAVTAAPGRTDEAAAASQMLIGAAVLLAPLLLGALADRLGVSRAFAVEPALIALALLLLAAGRAASRPQEMRR